MKTKINLKFVVILLLAAFVVTGAVGAVWFYRAGDATRFFVRGDELMAEGDYVAASRQYSRGIGRDPGNREYLHKYQEAIRNIQPATGVEAREEYDRYLTSLRHAVQHHGHVAEYHLELIEELKTNAQSVALIGGRAAHRGFWQQVQSAADDMLLRIPETDPRHDLGYLYRGWANIELIATVTESDLNRALDDLKTFVERNPEHDLGRTTLINAKRTLGEHYRTEGQQRRGEQLLEDYYSAIEQAREEMPDAKYVLAAYTNYIAEQSNRNREDEILRDYLSTLADELYATGQEVDDDPLFIHRAATSLLLIRDLTQIRRGLDLYNRFIEDNPEALIHRHYLAQLHYRLEEFDTADRILNEVLEAEPLRVSFTSQLQSELRRRAAAVRVDTAYGKWQRASIDERAEAADLLKQRHDRLRELIVDEEGDPLMMRADAKLAFVRGDHHTAADRLERLIRQGLEDFETLSLAALALEQIDQIGLAHERMSRAVEVMPVTMPMMLYNKAQFEYRLGRFEDARESLRELRTIAPEDPRVIQLARNIERALDNGGSASGSSRLAGSDDPATALLNQAQEQYNDGDVEASRALVLQGLQQWPQDVRFLAAAARIEMLDGNTETAQQYLSQALEIQPDNRVLRQLEASFATDDPIEAARRYTEHVHRDDEVERAVTMLLTINALKRQQEAMIGRDTGDADEQAVELLSRYEREVDAVLETAIDVAPTDPRVIEFRLNRAVNQRDWELAEQLVELAAEANADQAGGLLYRGAYLVERERFADAVRVFQDAADRMPYSSQAWRGLGVAYSRIGNMRDAQRAFEQSYRINPNNLSTVREYMSLLERMGDHARALRLAQSSRRIFPQNRELREHWLELESQVGDQALALRERRERFRENPSDEVNAMRLALFLTRTQPADFLLLDNDGSRRYSSRRWSAMGSSEQRRVLNDEARQWRREADRIIESIYEHQGRRLETVAFEASVQRLRGNVNEGEQLLREYLASLPEDEIGIRQRLALAQYLIETGRYEQAAHEIAAAKPYQNPDQREADRALANLRFMLNDYAGARELYEPLYERSPDREVALRYIESLVQLGETDEARTIADDFRERGGDLGDRGLTVLSLISRGEADHHFRRGEDRLAQAKLEEHYRLLDEAIEAVPNDASAQIILAQSKLWEHRRTGRRDLLDDARLALTRAEELAPNDARVSFMRVDVYRAQGQVQQAIREINTQIERTPMLSQAHRVRLGLYIEARDVNGALEAVRHSAETFPQSVVWQDQYSRLLAEVGEHQRAADVAYRVFELDGTAEQLARYVGLEMELDRISPRDMIQLLNQHRALVDGNPALEGPAAALLHRAGEAASARGLATTSYRSVRRRVETGEQEYRHLQNWFNNFGRYLQKLNPVEAEQFLVDIVKAQGGQGDADLNFVELAWLSRAWAAAGREGISRAIELAERAGANVPPDLSQVKANILFDLSGYQIVMEDFTNATKTLEQVVEFAPDNAMAQNNLAFILAEHLDQPQRAEPHAKRAYELNPGNASIVDTLGWTKFKLGKHARAETLLREALELRDSAYTRVHLARVLIETNRREAATEHLRQALDLDPDSRIREEANRLLADM